MATGKIIKEFIVDNVTPSDAFSISANATTQKAVSCAKSGYVPIGILGINADDGSSQNNLLVYECYITSDQKVKIGYKNTTSTAASVKPIFNILYQKT